MWGLDFTTSERTTEEDEAYLREQELERKKLDFEHLLFVSFGMYKGTHHLIRTWATSEELEEGVYKINIHNKWQETDELRLAKALFSGNLV